MCTCQIQWITRDGRPTPDTNPAIGRCRTRERTERLNDGRDFHHTQSAWFNICAVHAERLYDAGMHIWEFEPFAPPIVFTVKQTELLRSVVRAFSEHGNTENLRELLLALKPAES